MKNVEVYLSEKEWVKKPTSEETKNFIAKPILKNKVSLSLKDLAQEISESSKVCMLGLYPKRTKSASGKQIESQEVLMLDIDNSNKEQEHFTYEEALNSSFVKNHVAFMYKTLSHTEKHNRFRLVITLNKNLTTKEEVTEVYTYLFNILRSEFKGQLYEGIKNANRLFFGGTQGFDVIDWNNTFNHESILLDESLFSSFEQINYKRDNKKSLIPERIGLSYSSEQLELNCSNEKNELVKLSDTSSITNNSYTVYDLLKQKRFSDVSIAIKNKKSAYKGLKFSSLMEFRDDLNKNRNFSMQEFLDLPKKTPFLDILHDEKNPSSGIYISDEGVELYKCFSKNSKFTGDIVSVINKLTKDGEVKTMANLAEWLGIELDEPKEIIKTKESLEFIKSELLSKELKNKYPFIYKMFWRYTDSFCALLDIFSSKGYIYNETSGNYEMLSYMSRETINKEYANYFGKPLALTTLHTTINLMAVSFLIKKLSFKDIPRKIKTKLLNQKKINGYTHYTDVIVIPRYEDNFMEYLNDFCKKLNDTSFTKTTLSKDYVLATYGRERADNTFTQVKPSNKDISEKFQETLKATIKIIDREFKKSNFIQESDVIKRLFKNLNRKGKINSKTDAEIKYKQIRSTLEDGYGYKRVKLTKDLRIELGITNKDIPNTKRPQIYVRQNSL